jgi:hypothetical protein
MIDLPLPEELPPPLRFYTIADAEGRILQSGRQPIEYLTVPEGARLILDQAGDPGTEMVDEDDVVVPKPAVVPTIAEQRRDGIYRVNSEAGRVRARFVTTIPAQDMVYLEKAAEARRYLAAYPAPEHEPAELDDSPELGFPFIATEIGITGPTAFAVAQTYVQGAALFRQVGAAIEGIRLGGVAAIEAAPSLVVIDATVAAVLDALLLIPIPEV